MNTRELRYNVLLSAFSDGCWVGEIDELSVQVLGASPKETTRLAREEALQVVSQFDDDVPPPPPRQVMLTQIDLSEDNEQEREDGHERFTTESLLPLSS